MATYKVWLTVKDGFGNTKEVDGGTINVDLDKLSKPEIDYIEDALPLEDYIKKDELAGELADELQDYATDAEVEYVVQTNESLSYADLELLD